MYFKFVTILTCVLCVYGSGAQAEDRVKVQIYYECLCPFSRQYYIEKLKPAVLELLNYIDLETNPYGKAETYQNGDQFEFKCQHGPVECYGDKLHACAIDVLDDVSQYVLYNACLMEGDNYTIHSGSDDAAADRCAQTYQVDSEPIKECAKSNRGSELLAHYGESRPIVNYKHVPYVVVNGVHIEFNDDLQKVICKSIQNPPPLCQYA